MLPLLSIFGQLETFVADELYPYRYVITPVLALLGIAALALAVKAGVHRWLWQHRLATAIVGAPLLVVAVIAGDYLVSPLWERSHLVEAHPLASAGSGVSSGNSVSMLMGATHRGKFAGADDFHFGRGDALIIKGQDGSNVLRFENFSVRNGPDLYVYLSRDVSGKKVDEALNLGRLKATDGAFNYAIPSNLNLSDIKSVVVWCRQFAVLFSVAQLQKT